MPRDENTPPDPAIPLFVGYILGSDLALRRAGGRPLTLLELCHYGQGARGDGRKFQSVTIGDLVRAGDGLVGSAALDDGDRRAYGPNRAAGRSSPGSPGSPTPPTTPRATGTR